MGRGEEEEGRPRNRWMEEILAGTGMGLEELKEVVRNRSACSMLTIIIWSLGFNESTPQGEITVMWRAVSF